MSGGDPLDAASDELYAGAPAEFVARRDALAAEARSRGDRDLAAALKGLRRPSVGAWYLNTAARSGLVSLRELLKLGEELRQAQSAGDLAALRDLAARRGPLVNRVLRDLTGHLTELGTTATPAGLDEVRRTLAAALAEPEVAELVRRGRLDRAHDYSGFGPVVPVAEPFQSTPSPTATETADPDKAARAEAANALAQAQASLAAASGDLADQRAALAQARTRAAELEAALQQATAEVAQRETSVAVAAERERLADEALDRARQALARFGQ